MIREDALKRILTTMFRNGTAKKTIQQLYRFIVKADARDLHFQNPNYLAIHLNLDRISMLNLVVQGVLYGLFEMQWDVHCPHCGTIAGHTHVLGEVHEHNFCPSCQVNFDSYADQNILLTISLHPSLFTEAQADQTITRKKDDRVQPVSALELIGIPAFNEHFAAQIPPLDHSVKIRSATLMFTDLIQSTQLYSQIGDIKAYTFVKQHFDILFAEILNHSGGIIKTIGDAVMAVFTDTSKAVSVAFELKKAVDHLLQEHTLDEHYGLRVSISSGPALVVNMNDQIDLFGSMVNRGARLVGFASKETIAVSEEIMSHTTVQQFISEQHIVSKVLNEPLKGFPGLNTLFLLRKV